MVCLHAYAATWPDRNHFGGDGVKKEAGLVQETEQPWYHAHVVRMRSKRARGYRVVQLVSRSQVDHEIDIAY